MRFLLNPLLARGLVGSAVPLVLFTAVGLVAALVIDRLLDALRWERHAHLVLIEALQQRQRLEVMNEVLGNLPPEQVARSTAYQEARLAFLRPQARLLARPEADAGSARARR